MEPRKLKWWEAVLVVIPAIGLLVLLVWRFAEWLLETRILHDENASGWTQAVFSGAAVLAAIGVVAWQLVHARRERTSDEIRMLENIGTQIFFCRVIALELEVAVLANVSGVNLWDSLKAHATSLASISIIDYPAWSTGFHVAQVKVAFVTLETVWANNARSTNRASARHAQLTDFLRWTIAAEKAILGECRERGKNLDEIRHQLSYGLEAVFADPTPRVPGT